MQGFTLKYYCERSLCPFGVSLQACTAFGLWDNGTAWRTLTGRVHVDLGSDHVDRDSAVRKTGIMQDLSL